MGRTAVVATFRRTCPVESTPDRRSALSYRPQCFARETGGAVGSGALRCCLRDAVRYGAVRCAHRTWNVGLIDRSTKFSPTVLFAFIRFYP